MALGHAASCASKMCPPPRRVLTRHAETSTRTLHDGARFITASRTPCGGGGQSSFRSWGKLTTGTKRENDVRKRQDSNLRGETPADFESAALTARPRLQCVCLRSYAASV